MRTEVGTSIQCLRAFNQCQSRMNLWATQVFPSSHQASPQCRIIARPLLKSNAHHHAAYLSANFVIPSLNPLAFLNHSGSFECVVPYLRKKDSRFSRTHISLPAHACYPIILIVDLSPFLGHAHSLGRTVARSQLVPETSPLLPCQILVLGPFRISGLPSAAGVHSAGTWARRKAQGDEGKSGEMGPIIENMDKVAFRQGQKKFLPLTKPCELRGFVVWILSRTFDLEIFWPFSG